MGADFCGKSEKALKINFRFVTAISPGVWHCTSDDVIDTHARSHSRSSLLLPTETWINSMR